MTLSPLLTERVQARLRDAELPIAAEVAIKDIAATVEAWSLALEAHLRECPHVEPPRSLQYLERKALERNQRIAELVEDKAEVTVR